MAEEITTFIFNIDSNNNNNNNLNNLKIKINEILEYLNVHYKILYNYIPIYDNIFKEEYNINLKTINLLNNNGEVAQTPLILSCIKIEDLSLIKNIFSLTITPSTIINS